MTLSINSQRWGISQTKGDCRGLGRGFFCLGHTISTHPHPIRATFHARAQPMFTREGGGGRGLTLCVRKEASSKLGLVEDRVASYREKVNRRQKKTGKRVNPSRWRRKGKRTRTTSFVISGLEDDPLFFFIF